MNANRDPAAAAPADPDFSRARRGVGWGWKLLALAGIAALAGNAYWGYGWYQNQTQASRAARDSQNVRLADLEQQFATFAAAQPELARRLDALQQSLRQLQTETQTRAAQQNERLDREAKLLAEALNKLRADFSAGAEAWRLAEIEQLLVIAGQRARLTGEAELALVALRLADEGLRQLAAPSLAAVRAHLAREIAALTRVEKPDTAAVLRDIASLAKEMDALPVLGESAATTDADAAAEAEAARAAGGAAAEDKSWRGWVENVLADVRALVQFETAGEPLSPILSAELRVMTVAKIKWILESAKIAFMRRQGELYVARLRAAESMVKNNFATDTPATQAWLQRLQSVAAISPAPALPEIGASLRALRAALRPN